MSMLERAIAIAVEAHHGQRDKVGRPYILHPLRMMCRLDEEKERIVAVLHDVVEDTKWTFKDLEREGFSEEILEALDCVTKREGEPYDEFVNRSASNPLALRVKLADLEDNMDLRRLKALTQVDGERMAKYLSAWRHLKEIASGSGGRGPG